MNIIIKVAKPRRPLVALVALALVLAGCGPSASARGVSVVASTDVWGDVALQVAGARAGHGVEITAIITDPSADPHSYEASVRNQLALDDADVVVENGGGYDTFMTSLRRTAHSTAPVVDAVRTAGRAAIGAVPNEHVWYDLPTVRRVAAAIADALARVDPDHAATYRTNAAVFGRRIDTLIATERSVRRAAAGTGVAVTEPVPLYLLHACGLVDRTPSAFSRAVEDGNDVPVRALQQTLDLLNHRRVALLAYNEQTGDSQTRQLRDAAERSGVPVVSVAETLPSHTPYLAWMAHTLAAVRAAVTPA